MRNGFPILLIFFIAAFSIIIFKNLTKNICLGNFDCEWKITNCCPETAWAKWECVNKKSFKEIECPKFIICPKIFSPKPNLSCECVNGECVAK
jgi:hypothetical protein